RRARPGHGHADARRARRPARVERRPRRRAHLPAAHPRPRPAPRRLHGAHHRRGRARRAGRPEALMTLEVRGLTKRYGATTAVEDLSFTVTPGAVTAFLGPNGAGKTTTLRILLGLVHATSGTATIDGARYADLAEPGRSVGAVLEQGRFHPGRRGRDHLRVVARAIGVGEERIDELLDLVGLRAAARQRVDGYSLGMRQRLDIATALLGDPLV